MASDIQTNFQADESNESTTDLSIKDELNKLSELMAEIIDRQDKNARGVPLHLQG